MAKEIKLSPEQQACVEYQGVTAKNLVIQGVAGSGKSTVLMGRAAQFIMKEYKPGQSNHVIIFTYNNTLVSYIKELFKIDESKATAVKITTLDAYLTEIFRYTPGSNRKRAIDKAYRKRYMQKALDAHKCKYGAHRLHDAGADFWVEECLWMRDMNIGVKDFEVYRSLPRKGRGGKVKIFDADRETAFQIYLSYIEQLDAKYLCEASDRYLFLSHHLSSIADRFKYDHVLIDEAQDQSLTKMLVVASLCKKDATISMDMNQRIYKQSWTMKQLGLPSITKTLKHGMRCSPEVHALATDLVSHNKDAIIDNAPAKCEHGPLPIIKKLSNEYETKKNLISLLKDWTVQDPDATIGILGAKNKSVEKYGSWLTDTGLTYELIKPDEQFSVGKAGIKLSTVHSAKGLEFTHVIIPDFDDDIYPWPVKIDDAEIIEDNLQEGRNRGYVAMTRAKKQLLILCGPNPSRYVAELNSELYQAFGFNPVDIMQQQKKCQSSESITSTDKAQKLSVTEISKLSKDGYSTEKIVPVCHSPKPNHISTQNINYDEIDTAKNLYDKYQKHIGNPFVIVRKSWRGDYCFVVDGFFRNNTWVKGRAFKDGMFERSASYHADVQEFHMYNGPSLEIIKSQV